jgi:hypothetical protein
LTLVALLLAGCGLFGPKSFDIVVRIEPPVEGVKIFVDGVYKDTTDADGEVELKVKANATLTAELEGYTFKQKEITVTGPGKYVFEKTSPGRKRAIVDVKTVLEDIQVLAGETPFEDLRLPSTVEVVLDDDEEVEVAVDWTAAEEDYDYETAGVYKLEGVLVPGEGIINPYNITVKVKVVVEDKGRFDRWTVEVQSAYLNEIVFVIKALNKAGEAYDGWDDDSGITVNVKVDAEIETASEDNIEAVRLEDDRGVWTVTTKEIEFGEITEDVVATLTITGKEAGEEIEYVAETEPFLVDAKPTKIKVEADRQTYKSGETISLTLTLQYGDEDEPQTVYTYEGSHVVMINWGGASGLQVYNRKATFANGVADGIEFEAWEKGEGEEEEVTLAVTIVSDEWESPVTGNLVISVEAGDPETLDAVKDDYDNILITVRDKLGQVVDWFEPEQAEVQLRVKGESIALAQSQAPPSAKPGVDGVAYVSFEKGRATIVMVGSGFADKLASEYEEEEDKVVDLIVELVDYELETEIKWTIPTGAPGS